MPSRHESVSTCVMLAVSTVTQPETFKIYLLPYESFIQKLFVGNSDLLDEGMLLVQYVKISPK